VCGAELPRPRGSSPLTADGADAGVASAAPPHLQAWVVLSAALVAAGYFASITVRVLVGDQHWIVTEYAAVAGAIAGLALALNGWPRSGGAVVVIVVWAELHASMMLANGPPTTAGLPVFPVLIMGTGLLLGGRAAIALGAVTAVTVPLGIPVAQLLGSQVVWPEMGLHGYVVLGATMLASAVLVDRGMHAFRVTLQSRVAHEHKYAALAEHSPYGIVLLDRSGRVDALNPAAERLLGLSEAEARGRSFTELLGPAAAQLDVVFPPAGEVPNLGELELHQGSHRKIVEVSGSRTIAPDGSTATQILLRDVSVRRQVERHAIQLGRMLDQALSEVYVFDAETLRLQYANLGARRNLQYDAPELTDLTITDIAPALTRTFVREAMTELSARPDEVIALTGRHRRKDKTLYPVEARIHLVSFVGGSAVGLFALDISDRAPTPSEEPPPHPSASASP
jgi:PAS domain S-box-containing protein